MGAGNSSLNDRGTTSPDKHYGGAALSFAGGSDLNCTSAFAVTLEEGFRGDHADGDRGMLTAGHCYDDSGPQNGAVKSGTQDYGVAWGEEGTGSLPLINDGTVLGNTGSISGQAYTNRIYTNTRHDPDLDDPLFGNPTITDRGPFTAIRNRPVTSVHTIFPLTSPKVCYSGIVPANICNSTTLPVPIVFCPALDPDLADEGCVVGARLTTHPNNYQVSVDGDSGGPVYLCNNIGNAQTNTGCQNPTSDTLSAVGVIIARVGLPLIPDGLYQPVTDLEAELGVKVLTSP